MGKGVDHLLSAAYSSAITRTDTFLRRFSDAILSFIVEFNVILAWHGLWTIMDLWAEDYEFSHNYTAWISLGIGTFVNAVVFFVQFPYSTFTDDIFKKRSEK